MSERPPPSASELAAALSAAPPAPAPPRARWRAAIARPGLAVRVYLAVAGVALIVVLGLTLLAAWWLAGLARAVREDAAHRAWQERERLPEAAVLLDAEAARREARARPLAAPRIWEARCRLLAERGAWAELAATCAEVELASPDDLTAAARLWQVEALLALGRPDEARRAFARIDQRRLEDETAARAAALAARLWAPDAAP